MRLILLSLLILLASCISVDRENMENPFPSNSMFPNTFTTNGKVYISYIHSDGDTLDELYFATFDGIEFEAPVKVSEGKDWFVNWADVPAIAAKEDDILISWLDKSADGAYEYDIKMSLSADRGNTWSSPFIPHKDNINAEHGFVSIAADFQAIWLDGRDTINKQMTLRSGTINSDGSISSEFQIDDRVCDCCQTALEKTEIGNFAIYRNRSEEEIRDHYFSIFNDSGWSQPKPIYEDGWQIAGCPVNGPVLDSHKGRIAAAWYTEAHGKPEIYFSLYESDEGEFGKPTLISDENVVGRLDLIYVDENKIAISWMENMDKNTAVIKLNVYDGSGQFLNQIEIGKTASARGSGFPKIEYINGKIFSIYTETDPMTHLVTSVFEI